jgi:hypothetical protein
MTIFTPNTVIRSTEVNANFDELKTKTDYLTAPDSAWIEVGSGGSAPAFANNWVNYGGVWNTCAFRKDALGYVHLKGLVRNGTDEAIIFTLPVGYRPIKDCLCVVMSNELVGRIDITTAGAVDPAITGNPYISLDNIHFKAEQ